MEILASTNGSMINANDNDCNFLCLEDVLFPPITALLVDSANFMSSIIHARFVNRDLRSNVVLTYVLIYLIALPEMKPTTIRTARKINVQANGRRFLTFYRQRCTIYILRRCRELFNDLRYNNNVFHATRRQRIFRVVVKFLGRVRTMLRTRCTTRHVIGTTRKSFTFFRRLLRRYTRLPIMQIRQRISTNVSNRLSNFLLVLNCIITTVGIISIHPIDRGRAIPIRIFFRPLNRRLVINVRERAIIRNKIRRRKRNAYFRRFRVEDRVLLARVLLNSKEQHAILAKGKGAVARVILRADNGIILTGRIKILTLRASGYFASRFNVSMNIFAVVFPRAEPTQIASRINRQNVHPKGTSHLYFVDKSTYAFAYRFAIRNDSRVSTLQRRDAARHVNDSICLICAMRAEGARRLRKFLLGTFSSFLPLLRTLYRAIERIRSKTCFMFSSSEIRRHLIRLRTLNVLGALSARVRLRRRFLQERLLARLRLFLWLVPLSSFLRVVCDCVFQVRANGEVNTFLRRICNRFTRLASFLIGHRLLRRDLGLLFCFLIS